MTRSLLLLQALTVIVCVAAAVNALQASQFDCRKFPWFYKCRGISAKRSMGTTTMDIPSSKLHYDDPSTVPAEKQAAMVELLKFIKKKNLYDKVFAPPSSIHSQRSVYDEDEDVKDDDRIDTIER